jgi:hypothetical protein
VVHEDPSGQENLSCRAGIYCVRSSGGRDFAEASQNHDAIGHTEHETNSHPSRPLGSLTDLKSTEEISVF